ncbi:multidrug efflux SMR transporter [Aeromicrobium sp. Leaf350]|uniref:DMT family transporter n=1 Tax=Aeromicrobium sp. Leaf350 TaxID=2876565 RepID=UPI001E47F4CB|nr:SMR family transporter [Aeromicrobium sp. Leaf350]
MEWVYLVVAILTEVAATLSLRMASTGSRAWFGVVGVGYLAAFTALSLSLSEGMNLGVAYGIWAASGVALTAVLSRILFQEALTWVMSLGIVLIATGVLLVELGATH